MVDPHHAGFGRGRDRGRHAGRAVDHRHLAEELALAERDDHSLAAAVDLGDVDLAVEHGEQFSPARAFLENDLVDLKFVDAFFDGHGDPARLPPCSVFGRTPRGNTDPQAYFRETKLIGKGGAANDRADTA